MGSPRQARLSFLTDAWNISGKMRLLSSCKGHQAFTWEVESMALGGVEHSEPGAALGTPGTLCVLAMAEGRDTGYTGQRICVLARGAAGHRIQLPL